MELEERKPTITITHHDREFNLELDPELIAFWLIDRKNSDPTLPNILVYIFSLKNHSIWQGQALPSSKKLDGHLLLPEEEGYLVAVSCLRSYLGDLFMLRPFDLRILEAVSEINNQVQSPYDDLLRNLAKKK